MFSPSYLLLFLLFLLIFGSALLFTISYFSKPKYGKNRLMTDAEMVFYLSLLQATEPHQEILAQVRLASVVTLQNKFFLWEHFNPLGAKCVDFVLLNRRTGETLLVIELDDSSHQRWDRKRRDAFVDKVLAQAGVPILHQKWLPDYDVPMLREKIALSSSPQSLSRTS
jgi:hypothetical protein